MKHEKLKKMITIAMLSAMAFLMTLLSHYLPPVILFLKYDPKDIIIAIGGFIFGPGAAIIISVISSFIEMFTISDTGWIGLLMNALASASFAAVAALIYKRKKTFGRAIVGIILGSFAMTAMMILWNYLVTPMYLNCSREYVASLLIPAILPFNLLKAFLNSAFTILLYRPITNALRSAHLVKYSSTIPHDPKKAKIKNLLITLISFLAVIVLVGLMILMKRFN